MNLIVISGLNKQYGSLKAVRNLSFAINKGEIFGLLGPNGAGKTTTFHMLTGLARPSSGQIHIQGTDVVKYPKKAQALMGIVPDESNLYNEMDGFNNLSFAAALYGMKKTTRDARARELLEIFRLTEAGRRPYKYYSKGMKRKLTLAAALIHSPPILFLDEPTTGIDLESARQIRQMILGLKEKGTTIFLTTHYIEEAQRLCDRIAFLVKGRLVSLGTLGQLMTSISPRPRLLLVADQDLAPFAPTLQRTFAGSQAESQPDGSLIITSKDPLPLHPLISYLDEQNIRVYEAKSLQPSLEDIFIQMTGSEEIKSNINGEGESA